jgi:hypothetical protein
MIVKRLKTMKKIYTLKYIEPCNKKYEVTIYLHTQTTLIIVA